MIRSPTLTNSGTWTTAPVSSVAGFVTLETVSPLTPGSVSLTVSSTDAGIWIPEGLPLTARICTTEDGRMYASSPSTSPRGSANCSYVCSSMKCASVPSS